MGVGEAIAGVRAHFAIDRIEPNTARGLLGTERQPPYAGNWVGALIHAPTRSFGGHRKTCHPAGKPVKLLPWHLRLKVRLRVLLFAVLVLAVVLGGYVHQARRQRMAVDVIERNGGLVRYDWQYVNGQITSGRRPGGPIWLRRIVGDQYFQEVRNVVFLPCSDDEAPDLDLAPPGWDLHLQQNKGCKSVDELAQYLTAFPSLRSLYIQRAGATDAALGVIGSLSSLEEAHIVCPGSTDIGIARLRGLKRLKRLTIEEAKLTNVGLSHLMSLPRCETLCVSVVSFRAKREPASRQASRVRHLELITDNSPIERNSVGCLMALVNLDFFILNGASLSDESVKVLESLPTRCRLDLYSVRMSSDALQRLRSARPDLFISVLND
jgi:hypothetical protein